MGPDQGMNEGIREAGSFTVGFSIGVTIVGTGRHGKEFSIVSVIMAMLEPWDNRIRKFHTLSEVGKDF
tara:strand:+ start:272 stop:475 length:204 start_codon:yes stop_codon:yes gene_type:complete